MYLALIYPQIPVKTQTSKRGELGTFINLTHRSPSDTLSEVPLEKSAGKQSPLKEKQEKEKNMFTKNNTIKTQKQQSKITTYTNTIHSHRTSCCNCDYRDPRGDAAAGIEFGSSKSPEHPMHRQSETNRKCGGSLLCGFSEFHLSAENCKRFFPELSLGLRLRKVPGLDRKSVV